MRPDHRNEPAQDERGDGSCEGHTLTSLLSSGICGGGKLHCLLGHLCLFAFILPPSSHISYLHSHLWVAFYRFRSISLNYAIWRDESGHATRPFFEPQLLSRKLSQTPRVALRHHPIWVCWLKRHAIAPLARTQIPIFLRNHYAITELQLSRPRKDRWKHYL